MTHHLNSQLLAVLLPLTMTDDANDDSCDVKASDALDDDANENARFSNSWNWLKAVAGAVVLVILLLSIHHSTLLIYENCNKS